MSNFYNLFCNCSSKIGFAIISLIALMSIPLTISDAFAESESNLIWEFIFIKSDVCDPDDNLDKVYSSLTEKYFELYELENQAYDVNCMSEKEYELYQKNDDVQLLILMYDENVGEKILVPNNLDGMYIHTGNSRNTNHLVILCHCSDYDTGYERTLTSWILSHELSHFVLSFKGFTQTAIQEKIHDKEKEYDNCVGTNFQTSTCDEFKNIIRTENSVKDFVVMAPYEPAIGNKLIKYISNDYSNTEVLELQRNLAKMWSVNSIDDNAYAETLLHFVDPSAQSNQETHELFMEIPNGFVIAEESKPKDIEWDEYLNPDVSGDHKSILFEHIPFDLDEPVNESQFGEIPNWFKTRALLWSENRISDKVFFDGVEHLFRLNIIQIK